MQVQVFRFNSFEHRFAQSLWNHQKSNKTEVLQTQEFLPRQESKVETITVLRKCNSKN